MKLTVTVWVDENEVVLTLQELVMITEGMFKEFGIKGVQDILAKHGMKLEEGNEPTDLKIESV